MKKDKQLIVGNYYYLYNRITQAKRIQTFKEFEGCDIDTSINNTPITQFQPIPLSEEWLKEFDFNEFNLENYFWENLNEINTVRLFVILDDSGDHKMFIGNFLFDGILTEELDLRDAKFVHQLQSLYKEITGNVLSNKIAIQ